jgi:hypothetical protein
VPLFKVVIEIVSSRRCQMLKDVPLTRIEGEAWETWWSLSKAQPNDPTLADNSVSPLDFLDRATA